MNPFHEPDPYTSGQPTWSAVRIAPGVWQVHVFIWRGVDIGTHTIEAKRERDMRRVANALLELYKLKEAG